MVTGMPQWQGTADLYHMDTSQYYQPPQDYFKHQPYVNPIQHQNDMSWDYIAWQSSPALNLNHQYSTCADTPEAPIMS